MYYRQQLAKGSHDPDGNQLSYRWIAYPKAAVQVSNPALIAELQASRDKEALEAPEILHYAKDSGEQIDVQAKHTGTEHVILAVTDNGSPGLFAGSPFLLGGGGRAKPVQAG